MYNLIVRLFEFLRSLAGSTAAGIKQVLARQGEMQQELEAIQRRQIEQGLLLDQILRNVTPNPVVRVVFDLVLEDGQIQEGVTSVTLKVGETRKFRLRATDQFGNEAPFDGPPSFSISNPELGTFAADPDDPKQAILTAGTTAGSTQISGTVDADMGEGVRPIVGLSDIQILPGEVTVVTLEPLPV